jgi:ABC-type dipeptide/oligopeptide/nickel transport system ATPase subunit
MSKRFAGTLPLEGTDWQIGAIVGRSGTGKTTIAKQLFPDNYNHGFTYSAASVLDDFPQDLTVSDITKALTSVGFASPPDWLKPYSCLSQGEKMRVDIARALLLDKKLVVFDEFTSVVDREIAKVSSLAISKAIRKSSKQFIAVTCHYDILDWLEPDWIFNTDTMQYFKKKEPTQPYSFRSTQLALSSGECLGTIII